MRDFATDLLIYALWLLALARLTRLITKDDLTDFIRIWAYKRAGRAKLAETKLTYFLQCPWCVSMWLGAATAWYVFLLTEWGWALYPVVMLAGSYFVGVVATNLEGDEHTEVEIIDDEH